jgi:hypothetical protein
LKHASLQTLASLSKLLEDIRTRNGLIEKQPGVFYRKSRAFIHFHEDRAGLFMDIRDGKDWRRLPAADHKSCLTEMDRILGFG